MKTATRLAIIGVSLAIIMAFAGAYFQEWILKSAGLPTEKAATLIQVYWLIRTVLGEGSILLFLIVLHAKQKN